MSPSMILVSGARGATAGLGGAATGLGATGLSLSASPLAGGAGSAMALPRVGGAGMPDGGVSAALGQANTLGAVSVPPTWAGSQPSVLSSSAVQGLGSLPPPCQRRKQPHPPMANTRRMRCVICDHNAPGSGKRCNKFGRYRLGF
ncbi:hypothetical protein B1T51_09160 [Mycobacterium kansasii]|nr:hypothetical protein B1T51_09160 [Mycobacterium kansasii]ARG80095.1 hypothetical protein B1T52_09360 [Mycobacterium kansasii]ARG92205.1 hypothetical protein B1T50_09820 [Mycobacterium kansasii]ORC11017.1 hypothetical protein B1T46_09615 [Mycobacterium kansasii]